MSVDYGKISNYVLKQDIGEGNFGKVKLGIFKPTGEEFAVKILNKKKIKIKMKNTVFKENEIISKFNHVNVIFVFEIIEDAQNYYIIMEYCKKGELFDYIVERQKLEEEEASIFFYQLINGVEYIHSKKIAHRDLKPENLLLNENNILKIIDFGLSHEFDGTQLLKTKCGSPSYAAPEIIRGKPYDGFKTDIWCCGIILYAMVCGYLPFEGDNNKILFKNIVECNPEIPEYLEECTQSLISAILTPDPEDRITLSEIKKTEFYLKGKELCNINYDFEQKKISNKRSNHQLEDYKNKCLKKYEKDSNLQIVIDNSNQRRNSNNNSNRKENENSENLEEIDLENIRLESEKQMKVSNFEMKEDNCEKKEKINLVRPEKNNKENKKQLSKCLRIIDVNNKKKNINAIRDKILIFNQNYNKKIINYTNNINQILSTDANAIVSNKLKKDPFYINNYTKFLTKNKNNVKANSPENNLNQPKMINNIHTINIVNTISTLPKTLPTTITTNNTNYPVINSNPNKKDKRSINLKEYECNSVNKKIDNVISKKHTPKKIGIEPNVLVNNEKHKVYLTNKKVNIDSNSKNKHINIINNINNTINNYGTMNFVGNNNNINPNNHNQNINNILPKHKNNHILISNIKNENINPNQQKTIKKSAFSFPVKKLTNKNLCFNELNNRDIYSTKSSKSVSTKGNQTLKSNNSNNYKTTTYKKGSNNYSNVFVNNLTKMGFKPSKPINKVRCFSSHINTKNQKCYPQQPSSVKKSDNKYTSKLVYISQNEEKCSNNKVKVRNYTTSSKKSDKSSTNKNSTNSLNKKTDSINNKVNNNKSSNKILGNYNKNGVETNRKNKFKNSGVSSINSRITKNSRNSKSSRDSKNSKISHQSNVSKISKSSQNSKNSNGKTYNLLKSFKNKNNGNFVFPKKGGSEGKNNRFVYPKFLMNENNKNNLIAYEVFGNNMIIHTNNNNIKSNRFIVHKNGIQAQKKKLYAQYNMKPISNGKNLQNEANKKKKFPMIEHMTDH